MFDAILLGFVWSSNTLKRRSASRASIKTHPRTKLIAGVYESKNRFDKCKIKGGSVHSFINREGDSFILFRNISYRCFRFRFASFIPWWRPAFISSFYQSSYISSTFFFSWSSISPTLGFRWSSIVYFRFYWTSSKKLDSYIFVQ